VSPGGGADGDAKEPLGGLLSLTDRFNNWGCYERETLNVTDGDILASCDVG